MKNNILIICSHFPPGPRVGGTVRVTKLVKYLQNTSWHPIILTSNIESKANQSKSLFDEISKDVIIHRLPLMYPHWIKKIIIKPFINLIMKIKLFLVSIFFKESHKLKSPPKKKILKSYSQNFFIPDIGIFWSLVAGIRAIFIVFKHKPKIIMATAPFHSSIIAAYIASKITKTPYIIDLRDPWTTNPFSREKFIHSSSRIEESLEGTLFRSASKIICVHKNFIGPIKEKYSFLKEENFVVIPNGFDHEDFIDIEPIKYEKLSITHTGSFYQGRTPDSFIQALKIVEKHMRAFNAEWQINFIGTPHYQNEEKINTEIINFGVLDHKLTLKHMAGSDILLLIPGVGDSTLTGKLFEYIAVKKPILCISKEGAASKLLKEMGIGLVADPENINEIAESIIFLINNLKDHDFNSKVTKYYRSNIAKSFQDTFNLITKNSNEVIS